MEGILSFYAQLTWGAVAVQMKLLQKVFDTEEEPKIGRSMTLLLFSWNHCSRFGQVKSYRSFWLLAQRSTTTKSLSLRLKWKHSSALRLNQRSWCQRSKTFVDLKNYANGVSEMTQEVTLKFFNTARATFKAATPKRVYFRTCWRFCVVYLVKVT